MMHRLVSPDALPPGGGEGVSVSNCGRIREMTKGDGSEEGETDMTDRQTLMRDEKKCVCVCVVWCGGWSEEPDTGRCLVVSPHEAYHG